jgi:predicted anti-sigma-YlaC factor YlaD
MLAGAHLTSEEVAAYLDNTLSEADRARVKQHLAGCAGCREEIVSVSRLVDRAPRSKRRFVALSTMAAAVVVIFFARASTHFGPTTTGRIRGSQNPATSEGVTVVRAIAPIGDQKSSSTSVLFVWHPLSRAAVYRLTLTDDEGAKIWAATTNDTTLPLPKSVSLPLSGSYHWYVDVLQQDGKSATSGIMSFRVVR